MISNILWQFWHDSTMPEEIRQLTSAWQRRHPDFEHRLYDDQHAEAFIIDHHHQRVLDAYRSCRLPTMRADLFRYAVLSIVGGYYIDADEYCLEPITTVCAGDEDFIAYRARNGYVANSFLGCPANSPIMFEILEKATTNILQKVSRNLWEVTGALIVNQVLSGYVGRKHWHITILPHAAYRRVVVGRALQCRPESQHWSMLQKHQSIFRGCSGGIDDAIANLPIPPLSGRIAECGEADQRAYLHSGANDFRLLNQSLRATGHYLVAQHHMLELSCGFGRLTRCFLPLARTLKLRAADWDADGIDWCRRWLRHADFDLLENDVKTLPYADAAFNLIMVSRRLPTSIDPRGLFKELQRIACPDGLIFLRHTDSALRQAALANGFILLSSSLETGHTACGAALLQFQGH